MVLSHLVRNYLKMINHRAVRYPISTSVADLRNLSMSAVPKETFPSLLRRNPVGVYKLLEQRDTDFTFSQQQPILLRVLADVNQRLETDSLLELPQFIDFHARMVALQKRAIEIFHKGIPSEIFNPFVIDYVETMSALVKTGASDQGGTYHRDFAERLSNHVFQTGRGTHTFFTFKPVNDQYFWHIRPAATYLHWLVQAPPFITSAATYIGGPIVQPSKQHMRIDGIDMNFGDLEEVTKHDIGHSFYMQRQDKWLFNMLGFSRESSVESWNRAKNIYLRRIKQLSKTDRELSIAVSFLLSELIHERGYQYYLPILRQQLSSGKWTAMLQFKKNNNYWGSKGITDVQFNRLDEARKWLLSLTNDSLEKENLSEATNLRKLAASVNVRKWLPVEDYLGTPREIEIEDVQNMRIKFDVNGRRPKFTSLYQIALVLKPTATSPILTKEKIAELELWIWRKHNSRTNISLKLSGDGKLQVVTEGNYNPEPAPDNLPPQYRLSKVEIYKLERLLNLMRNNGATQFTVTHQPEIFTGTVRNVDTDAGEIHFVDAVGRRHKFNAEEIYFHKREIAASTQPEKYINLDPTARFVRESVLRNSYEYYAASLNPAASPYVTINRNITDRKSGRKIPLNLELGIINTEDPIMARAVSSVLTRSLEDAKHTNGGYLPPSIVQRVQTELISPHGVHNHWGKVGRRFVLSRNAGNGHREIIASALVGERRSGLLFLTSRFNNLRADKLREDIDFNVSADGNPEHRWFDKFAMPEIDRYKSNGYHHLANFVVEREGARGLGLSRILIDEIVKNYSRDHLTRNDILPAHSQRLLCGKGFWQIGDPPWLPRMSRLGFVPRLGAESFHIDTDWDPLIPTYNRDGKELHHREYNASFGLPQMYEKLLAGEDSPYTGLYNSAMLAHKTGLTPPPGDHMPERIAKVVELAKSGRAKFQYFQLLFTF